jgi:hypothetical protein
MILEVYLMETSQDYKEAFQQIIARFELRRERFWDWVGSMCLPLISRRECIKVPTNQCWFYGCNFILSWS